MSLWRGGVLEGVHCLLCDALPTVAPENNANQKQTGLAKMTAGGPVAVRLTENSYEGIYAPVEPSCAVYGV